MTFTRKFDGGLYEGTRDDGLAVSIVLKDGSGKFAYMRRYTVKVDGRVVGDRRTLKDAKTLALTAGVSA